MYTTAKLCNVKKDNVFKFANNYLESDAVQPAELPRQVSGRGSIKFIANHGKDRFSKLKEVNARAHTVVQLYFVLCILFFSVFSLIV